MPKISELLTSTNVSLDFLVLFYHPSTVINGMRALSTFKINTERNNKKERKEK